MKGRGRAGRQVGNRSVAFTDKGERLVGQIAKRSGAGSPAAASSSRVSEGGQMNPEDGPRAPADQLDRAPVRLQQGSDDAQPQAASSPVAGRREERGENA